MLLDRVGITKFIIIKIINILIRYVDKTLNPLACFFSSLNLDSLNPFSIPLLGIY